MKNIIVLSSLIILFISCSGDKYGSEITLNSHTSIKEILNYPDINKGREFLITGTISNVCQKKGCWMTIVEDSTEMFVRFKDYGFFMPKDGFGLSATAQGIYSNELIVEKNEAGEELEKISHLFTASAVILK